MPATCTKKIYTDIICGGQLPATATMKLAVWSPPNQIYFAACHPKVTVAGGLARPSHTTKLNRLCPCARPSPIPLHSLTLTLPHLIVSAHPCCCHRCRPRRLLPPSSSTAFVTLRPLPSSPSVTSIALADDPACLRPLGNTSPSPPLSPSFLLATHSRVATHTDSCGSSHAHAHGHSTS
jgi:hypothetical protein